MAKLKASLALVLFSMIAAAGIAAWALGHGGGPDAPTFRDTGGEVASNAGPPVDESPPAEEPPPERPAEKSPLPIKVSEVHYHPPDSRPRSEFIEVLNPGAAEADLSGSAFTKGIRFTFPAGFRLPPGGHAVICEDLEGFRAAFGGAPRVAGVYEGRLDNAGEKISLQDAAARVVSDFHYLEGPPWPREADGGGRSLERVRIGGDPDDAGAWAAGAPTPGAANGSKGPGEALSVYQPRHSPGAPGPRDEVVIEARVHSAAEAPKVTLHYEARGVRRALPMSPRGAGARADADAEGRAQPGEGASPDGDRVFAAALPRFPAGTIVRYRIDAEDGAGRAAMCPPAGASIPHEAFHVSREALSGKLPLCHIVIEPARLRGLLSNAFSNEMVDAAFAAGGKVRDVKIRARGAFARSWPKPSWKVIFPRDRPYRGQKLINWNSGWRDPAFIREKVAYDLFRAAGAPSLDSRMVRVHVNGEFWGLFVEVEQPKKQWLARQGIRGAALYKAFSRRNLADERDLGSADAYADHYEIEARKELGYEPLWLFARDLAGARRNLELFEARVDLDAYIPYLCAVAFTQNWDSFNKNHFLALDERGTGKWRVVPWDLDRTLGDHWNWRFDVSNIPVHNGAKRSPGATGWNRMAEAFFSEPALEKRFFDRLGKLLGDVWTEQKLLPLIDELRDAIEEAADLDRARWGGESDWRAAVEGLKRYVRERRAFLIDQVPVNLPATPWNAAPADGAIVSTFPIVLEASPFQHEDPAVRQVASHWQVRAAGGTYATPAADVRSTRGLAGLALPAGKLAPGETYHWRVAHAASNGKTSEFSAETSFRTGDFKLRASAFDLGPLFNKDLVANPGDAANDRLDARGGLLIEDGFDGARTGNPLAQGLPRDRRVGVHRLAPYDGPNAVQLTQRDRRTIRIAARPGRYGMVKLLVAGGTGDSTLPVTFEYADGSRGSGIVPCDDWYDDGPPEGAVGELQPGSTPILNGMDRIRAGFKDRNEPAIFEVTLECDPQRTLTAVLLEAGRGSYGTAQTSFNLFAVTGVEVE